MELVEDLQDNTALLEEAEQQEFEGLFHKDQEEFEPLGLFFPSLRLLQKFEFLLIARLWQEVAEFLEVWAHCLGNEDPESLEDETMDVEDHDKLIDNRGW